MSKEKYSREVMIRFRKSTSKSYRDALWVAEMELKGKTSEDGITEVKIPFEETASLFEPLAELLEIIKNWRGFEFFYQGIRRNNDWREIYYFIQSVRVCFMDALDDSPDFMMCERAKWGCYMLYDFVKMQSWLDYGKQEDGYWYVDKKAIFEELKGEAYKKKLECCPVFSTGNILRKIDALPDVIRIDKNWEVVELDGGKEVLRFREVVEPECPYEEGSGEWADWHIDKYVAKTAQEKRKGRSKRLNI